MKHRVTTTPAQYQPVTVTFTLESASELRALIALADRSYAAATAVVNVEPNPRHAAVSVLDIDNLFPTSLWSAMREIENARG